MVGRKWLAPELLRYTAVAIMYVKTLKWWSDNGADVVVSDGEYDCVAFCQPCALVAGMRVDHPLVVFMPDHVYRTERPVSVQSPGLDNGYAHRIVAEVVSLKGGGGLLQVNGLLMEIELLPGDIVPGDRVEFVAERLDIGGAV